MKGKKSIAHPNMLIVNIKESDKTFNRCGMCFFNKGSVQCKDSGCRMELSLFEYYKEKEPITIGNKVNNK